MKITKETAIIHSTKLAAYLLIVWGFYRFLFRLPEEIEELLIKPLLWLLPVFYFMRKEKTSFSSLGITTRNLFPSLYLSLGLGAFFALEGVLVNVIKYNQIMFDANIGQTALLISLGISFATAVSEELAFRGYLFTRMSYALGSEIKSNLVTSFVWGLIHLPISFLWHELSVSGIAGFFLLTTIFGIGSAFIFSKTRNIFSSILLHVFWSWPIVLFR